MRNFFTQPLLAALIFAVSSTGVAVADTNYEPGFQSVNRCVGGYLVQSGMNCIYAFAACEGTRAPYAAAESRDIHMTMTCRINADGTCPAPFECARDHGLTHVVGAHDPYPRACSRGTRNVECRWGNLLQH